MTTTGHFDRYHSRTDCLGSGMLKLADENPWLYKQIFVDGTRKPLDIGKKAEVRFGTLVHKILLEGMDAEDLVRPMPYDCLKKDGAINSVRLAAYRESLPEGVEVLKDDEFRRLFSCCNAFLASKAGREVFPDSAKEMDAFWVDPATGMKCKARLDMVCCTDKVPVIYDLKVGEKADPDNWSRIARKLRYWVQACHYVSGYQTLHGVTPKFKFVALESVEPYRVAVYEYDDISMERCMESYGAMMGRLKKRIDGGSWLSDWDSTVDGRSNTLTVNPWELGADEEGELEGFDD